MVIRTRRRTTIGEMKGKEVIGFRSKAKLDQEGFVEARWKVKTRDRLTTEYGYSKIGIPSVDYNTLLEDSRLNAVSKVLYREGYFVDQQNYEELDLDKIESTELIDYNFFYTQNQFDQYSRITKTQKRRLPNGDIVFQPTRYIVDRDEKGRFKRVYKDTALKDSKQIRKKLSSESFK